MRTKDAIDYFEGASNLAKAIGVTPAAITQWPELVPISRRVSVRLAMKARADELTKQAKKLRVKASEE